MPIYAPRGKSKGAANEPVIPTERIISEIYVSILKIASYPKTLTFKAIIEIVIENIKVIVVITTPNNIALYFDPENELANIKPKLPENTVAEATRGIITFNSPENTNNESNNETTKAGIEKANIDM